MKNRLLATTALVGLALFVSNPSFADCNPQPPANNGTMTCTVAGGAETTWTDMRTLSDVLVFVNAGAVVGSNTNMAALYFGPSGTASISGTVDTTGVSTIGIAVVSNGVVRITINAGGDVRGDSIGVYHYGGANGAMELTVDGTLQNYFSNGAQTSFTLGNTGVVTGTAHAGSDTDDYFTFNDTLGATFDTDLLTSKFDNYETHTKDGNTVTTLTGTTAKTWWVNNGTLLTNVTNNVDDVTIIGSAVFELGATGTGTFAGDVSGGGEFRIDNGSQITLTGNNSGFTGQMNITDSTVSISSQNQMSNASEISMDDATLNINAAIVLNNDFVIGSNDATFHVANAGHNPGLSGTISGSGDLIKTGGGRLLLTGTNTFAGRVVMNDGWVSIDTAASLGDSSATNDLEFNGGGLLYNTFADFNMNRDIIMTGNGTIATNGNDEQITGVLSGAGTLTKLDSGVLTLTGAHTHTGNLVIGGGALVLDESANRTYNGVIDGAGNLSKAGAGMLTLGGTSTNTGFLLVNGGGVVLNGSMVGSTAGVATGAVFGGTGTIGAINADGVIAPGISIGTLNVVDMLDFNATSVYDVEINDVGAGQSDNIIAGGAITIANGATLRISNFGGANTYAGAPYTYTILQGASVTGTFSNVNNTLAFLDAAQNNTGTALQLTMTRNDIAFSEVAKDEGQAQTADAVEDLGPGNDVYDAFTGLTTQEARAALDSLSGEHNAGVASAIVDMAGAIRTAITSHMIGLVHGYQIGNQAALAPAKDPSVYTAALFERTPDWNDGQVWFEALGTMGQSQSRRTTPSQDHHSYGALAGFDMPMEKGGWYGAFAGYENGEVETDSQRASSDLDNYHVGFYATRPIGNGFNISGGLGGTYHKIETQRYVIFPGFEAAPEGDTNGYTLTGYAEISKPLKFEALAVEPFANLSLTRSHMNGYTEVNGGGSELVVGDSTVTNPATTIGARFGKAVHFNDTQVNLNASLGWQHVFGDVDNGTDMRFAAGATTFDAYGPPRARDSAIVGLGASVAVGKGMNAYAGYNGTLAPDSQDHGFRAGVKIDF